MTGIIWQMAHKRLSVLVSGLECFLVSLSSEDAIGMVAALGAQSLSHPSLLKPLF